MQDVNHRPARCDPTVVPDVPDVNRQPCPMSPDSYARCEPTVVPDVNRQSCPMSSDRYARCKPTIVPDVPYRARCLLADMPYVN